MPGDIQTSLAIRLTVNEGIQQRDDEKYQRFKRFMEYIFGARVRRHKKQMKLKIKTL
jgi:hypothetical protein